MLFCIVFCRAKSAFTLIIIFIILSLAFDMHQNGIKSDTKSDTKSETKNILKVVPKVVPKMVQGGQNAIGSTVEKSLKN